MSLDKLSDWGATWSLPTHVGPQDFWGSGGERLLIFRELGSTGNYLRGAGE